MIPLTASSLSYLALARVDSLDGRVDEECDSWDAEALGWLSGRAARESIGFFLDSRRNPAILPDRLPCGAGESDKDGDA